MRCTLKGLKCADCAAKLERELNKVNGLEGVKINFTTKNLNLPDQLLDQARRVIDHATPGVRLVPEEKTCGEDEDEARMAQHRLQFFRIVLAGVLFIFGLLYNAPLHKTLFSWAEYIVLLSSFTLVGWPVLRRATRNLLTGRLFDESFLMSVATLGAIALHQLPEAAAVMLFYAIGEHFQERALNRSRRSIAALLRIQPVYANLMTDGGLQKVRPEEVRVGQTIIVKPGEKIPLDGEVTDGISFLDTSALTGEAVPRKVEPGKTALAGMINGQGLLTIRVAKPFTESSVARILALVEKAGERKAPTEQFITRFAHFYTPAMVFSAAAVALIPPLVIPGTAFAEWFGRALVLLVISCPCALMISIPLGYFGGIGGASRRGILVKGANFLDALANLHTVVFDKTGTLTKGVFRVTRVETVNGFSEEDVVAAAAGAETHSNHPIARSIREAYGRELPAEASDYVEIPGRGISAIVDGKQVLAGNDRLLHQEEVEHEVCEFEGTSVQVVIDGRLAGTIFISDELKEDAKETIVRLKKLGVKRTVMLTGDEECAARLTAGKIGLDCYFSRLLPEDKVRKVEELEAGIPGRNCYKLAFVGDGVNDAPVIARADIGVAMGGLGSDAAIEAADVVLMEDKPSKLADAVAIARRTRGIVRQNIALALGVKAFFLVLGTFGVANIWEAVFADVGVALAAIMNAARVLHPR